MDIELYHQEKGSGEPLILLHGNGEDSTYFKYQKLALVDDACQKLLTDEARQLLDSAGCAEVEITWGSAPAEAVEAILQAAGLRG